MRASTKSDQSEESDKSVVPTTPLYTERLCLRPYEPADADAFFALLHADRPRFQPSFPDRLQAVRSVADAALAPRSATIRSYSRMASGAASAVRRSAIRDTNSWRSGIIFVNQRGYATRRRRSAIAATTSSIAGGSG